MTKTELERENEILKSRLDNKDFQVKYLAQALVDVKNSKIWKMSKPYRLLGGAIKKTVAVLNEMSVRIRKALFQDLAHAFVWKTRRGLVFSPFAFGLGKSAFERQRKASFSQDIKISVLTAFCNSDIGFLQESVASVLAQSYENWELCLVDFCEDNPSERQKKIERILAKDARVKYKRVAGKANKAFALNEAAKMAAGAYISLLDGGDLLHPSALYETIKAICEKGANFIYTDEAFFRSPNLHKVISTNFKPDFSPDYFYSINYIHRFVSFKKRLFDKIGGFCEGFENAQDYDLFLRFFELTDKIVHVQKCLYYCRAFKNGGAGAAGIAEEKTALKNHFARVGRDVVVSDGKTANTHKIDWKITGAPLVSILIPNCDHWKTLKKCIDSVTSLSTYKNYEIIIVENNSKDAETFSYYDSLRRERRIRIVIWDGAFNYSAINNFAAAQSKGDYILLLNNDTEVISPSWIEEMLMFAQRKDVGAVGAKLYYPSEKIQHGGVFLGMRGVADHSHKYFPRASDGYASRLSVVQDLTCVTAACCMIPGAVYKKVGGLDEAFEVAFNDTDLCMRIRKAGYLVVWTPFAELYHYESESRGKDNTPEKEARYGCEVKRFQERWRAELFAGDPYYNPNLSLRRDDFFISGDVFPG